MYGFAACIKLHSFFKLVSQPLILTLDWVFVSSGLTKIFFLSRAGDAAANWGRLGNRDLSNFLYFL
jgi:hypothetical protein